jgi:hypothetical protein
MKLAMNNKERFWFVNSCAHAVAGAFHAQVIAGRNMPLAIGRHEKASH